MVAQKFLERDSYILFRYLGIITVKFLMKFNESKYWERALIDFGIEKIIFCTLYTMIFQSLELIDMSAIICPKIVLFIYLSD